MASGARRGWLAEAAANGLHGLHGLCHLHGLPALHGLHALRF